MQRVLVAVVRALTWLVLVPLAPVLQEQVQQVQDDLAFLHVAAHALLQVVVGLRVLVI